MIAYKGFGPGLICLGHQFQMGLNVTDKANCAQNGFHCAEDPLDCLSYYPRMESSEYCLVDAGGDIDEDDRDSKISCTELTILRRLEPMDFFLHALLYMTAHPTRSWNRLVQRSFAIARDGFAVVRGVEPMAKGKLGDILAFARESRDGRRIVQITVVQVDGEKVLPDTWYNADLIRREAA